MSVKPSLYSTITIESNDGRTADVRLGVVSFDYYEDVLCPTLSAKIQIANVAGMISDSTGKVASLYDGMKLRGGEAVRIKVEPNSASNIPIDFLNKPLYIRGVNNVIREAQKEFFELSLVSLEALENEVKFLYKSFPKETPISDHVSTIVSENFSNPGEFTPDRTSNKLGFIGNQMHPFDMLIRLASKSVPDSTGNSSAGFFFYQTREGFQFKSVDTLLSQSPKASYFYTEVNVNSVDFHPTPDLPSPDLKIIRYEILKNQDLVAQLKKGTYASARRFFDPYKQRVTERSQDFLGSGFISGIQNLGQKLSDSDLTLTGANLSFTELPSQILTEVFDLGTVSNEVENGFNSDPMEYISQRKMRYNTLFTQVLSIMVPLNSNLHAGDVIDCQVPEISFGNNSRTEKEQISGLYMIKELNHHCDPRGSYTTMKIVRDTYGTKRSSVR